MSDEMLFPTVECELGRSCIFPKCKGHAWRAKSNAVEDVKAFEAAVAEECRRTHEQWPNKAAARVYRQAMADPRECMLR